MIKKIILTVTVIILFIAVCISVIFLLPNIKSSEKTEYLLIHKDASFDTVLDSLKSKKSVLSTFSFTIAARLSFSTDKFKPGCYELKSGMNNLRLLNNLRKGRQMPIRITFNNIRTKEQLCKRLSDELAFSYDDIYNLLNDNQFLKNYGTDSYNAVSIFIPDTYEVYWTISTDDFIDKIYKSYLAFWTPQRIEKASKINLTPWQVSTLASIVEEETNLIAEKPIVAGLYINRLNKGMKLQADPTIKFAVGDFGIKRIMFGHIEKTKDSPYNTYKNEGLPPGPIRIPSKESIDAVLNYTNHPYLYMCAKGNGNIGHDFTRTFDEHKRNAARYRNNLNQIGIK
jgi:UPF0755 protein